MFVYARPVGRINAVKQHHGNHEKHDYPHEKYGPETVHRSKGTIKICLLCTNHSKSKITSHQSPVTSHQSPVTNHQSQIANHQSSNTCGILICEFRFVSCDF